MLPPSTFLCPQVRSYCLTIAWGGCLGMQQTNALEAHWLFTMWALFASRQPKLSPVPHLTSRCTENLILPVWGIKRQRTMRWCLVLQRARPCCASSQARHGWELSGLRDKPFPLAFSSSPAWRSWLSSSVCSLHVVILDFTTLGSKFINRKNIERVIADFSMNHKWLEKMM